MTLFLNADIFYVLKLATNKLMMSVCQLFFHYSFVSMSPPPVLLQILVTVSYLLCADSFGSRKAYFNRSLKVLQ